MNGSPRDLPFHNPFSPMAVARISDGDEQTGGGDITVPTDAIRRATGYVTEYFRAVRSPTGGQSTAQVILILGDYGTGKTHLAAQLVRTAAALSPGSTRTLHVEASAENLLRTYQRLLNKLGLERVRSRVSDFYADIVAEQLDNGLADDDMVVLVRNREVAPEEIVSRHSLMESALLREVKRRLLVVTQNEVFVNALTLLLRRGFDDAVWSWLGGATPDPILVDRGITEPISTTIDLFEAMGVLALLFGGRDRRFLLVIDEFDQIFSQAREADDSVMTGFQKMLEVFTKAEACLVLCGHRDFLNMLGPANLDRITYRVELAGLSVDQAIEFIARAQEAELGRRRLAPFTRESVGYMISLAGGNARQFIRMCHRLFRDHHDRVMAGADPDTPITAGMVAAAARQQFGALSGDEIISLARRVLTTGGWTYLHEHYLGSASESQVDFWVTFGDRTGGCAVLVTESLLNDDDVDDLVHRIVAVHDAVTDVELVVVVNGALGARPAAQLRESLDTEPLVYAERTFTDDFYAMIGAAGNRLPAEEGVDPLSSMSQRLDQLAKQQSGVYGLIEQLANHIDRARASADAQADALRHDLANLAGAVAVRETTEYASAVEARPGLPVDVGRLFTDTIRALDEITPLAAMMTQALAPGSDEIIAAVQRRVTSTEYREAVGVAMLLRHAVSAFGDRVLAWYASNEPIGSSGRLSNQAEDELEDVCRTYDAVLEFLPVFKLDELVRLGPWPPHSGTVADLSRTARRGRLFDSLEDLGPRVRQAARKALLANGG